MQNSTYHNKASQGVSRHTLGAHLTQSNSLVATPFRRLSLDTHNFLMQTLAESDSVLQQRRQLRSPQCDDWG